MKYRYILLFLTWIVSVVSFTQTRVELLERPEVYISFDLNQIETLKASIPGFSPERSEITAKGYAYIPSHTFAKLQAKGLNFEVEIPPSMRYNPDFYKGRSAAEMQEWDAYPTYEAYVDLMYAFAEGYPDLCEIVSIGTLQSGRELLAARITDHIGQTEAEPEFLYTATMHGDETAGYVISLHLIDYLLENYGQDPLVTKLVDELDIYINPLANPDGTYAGGNQSVWGATRGNSNGIDLNRNYPDFEDGPHPDGNAYQEETLLFMDFAAAHNFVMAANMHGGTEVCNYPYDTWSALHADDNWWQYVCREYADTAQAYSPAGYMTDLNNGITNGYAWYSIAGGRQDYMNYYHHCREFTLEMSQIKLLPESQLLNWWNYNYRSLLNYMDQLTYGFYGNVYDSISLEPLEAEIILVDHDYNESHVVSSLPFGNFRRPVKSGTYSVEISAERYLNRIYTNLNINDRESLELQVLLKPDFPIAMFLSDTQRILPGQEVDFMDTSYGQNIIGWDWYFEGAEPETSTDQNPQGIKYDQTGLFDVRLIIAQSDGQRDTLLKSNYIMVSSSIVMENTEITTCNGVFFDSGGDFGIYGNNENLIMTFFPALANHTLEMDFNSFNIELSDDCAYDYLGIYDGPSIASPLIGIYCGTSSPGRVISSASDGSLTFHFVSNEDIREAGWSANISCRLISASASPEQLSADIHMYPNPVHAGQSLYIENAPEKCEIRLVDLYGSEILVVQNQNVINLESIRPGNYLLQLTESDASTIVKKILVID